VGDAGWLNQPVASGRRLFEIRLNAFLPARLPEKVAESGADLPASTDIECRDAPENPDLAALRGIQHQNPIVRHELPGATVKEQDKPNLTIGLICRPSSIADTKFAALYPVKQRPRFGRRDNRRLNRDDGTLGEHSSFLRIRGIEKFLEAFPC
jgi:hypothetical protein